MDKNKDRLESCSAQLKAQKVQFERYPAIYGRDIAQSTLEKFYNKKLNKTLYKKELSVGEIGCYLSHMALWQKIVDEKLDYAVILEDDFTLSNNFNKFPEIIDKLIDWDYIRIAFPSRSPKVTEKICVSADFSIIRFDKIPINTLGQIISLRGAKKLLGYTNNIFRPVDVDIKHCWEKNIDVLTTYPYLINNRANFESEISKMSKTAGRGKKSSAVANLRFKVNYEWNNMKYRLNRPHLKKYIKEV